MNGKLTKISENKNALRTNSVMGEFVEYPEVGMPFFLFGKALDMTDPGYFRQVNTSVVQEVKKIDTGIEFRTLNSVYRLEDITNFDA